MTCGLDVATGALAGASQGGASQSGGGRTPRPGKLGRGPRFRAAVARTLVRSWCGAAAVLAGDAAVVAGGGTGDARPNILFIFSDDHAGQAIGAYGSRINRTPHIDRLAREGALFANSFCANSVCGPSRACILTGKHSHANGFLRNGDRFDGIETTFP